jgi:hypothetical protein
MQDEFPMQQRPESEQRSSGPEHAHAPPAQSPLQHCTPSAPPDAPQVADCTPGCRQQEPARHATFVP